MKITIHRGSSEFGGCCIEVCSKRARVLFDMGFPLTRDGKPLQNPADRKAGWNENPNEAPVSESDARPDPGILPPIDGLYRWDKPAFDAVILVQVDLDHDSLLQWLHPDIPVWISSGTKVLIEQARHFRLIPPYSIEFQLFPLSRSFTIRDIMIQSYRMDHTICDISSFEVRADGQTFLYAGNFSENGSKPISLGTFTQQAARQAELLLIEGSMFGRDSAHLRTEEEIEQELVALMAEPGPFFFQCASQNIDRIITFYNACRNTRRQFIIDPFTANVLYELRKLGYSLPTPGVGSDAMHVFRSIRNIPQTNEEPGRARASRFSRWSVSRPQVMSMADRVCMLVRPAMLTDLRKMPGLRGGQLVFSMMQFCRDTIVQKRLEHLMLSRGTTVVPLHTGGHARIDDLQLVVDALQPQKTLLVNELQPDLLKRLQSPVRVLQNGATIEL